MSLVAIGRLLLATCWPVLFLAGTATVRDPFGRPSRSLQPLQLLEPLQLLQPLQITAAPGRPSSGRGEQAAPAPGARVPPAAALEGNAPAGAFQDQTSVNYVLVPVLVKTRSGFANRLEKKDFDLRVDGRQVAIESFDKRTEAPTSLVFLQDLSGSMATGGKMELSRKVVSYFLGKALPGDEFALATFASGRGTVEVPFTTDSATVREAISLWQGYGTTALHDAVAWIPDISAEGHNSRRFAVVVTDGADNASQISPEQAREIVKTSQIPVYVMGLGSGSPYELAPGGVKRYRYADVLNLLALATGGRYFPIEREADLDKALAVVAEDLRHQYVLGFPTTEGGVSRFRRLEVAVKGRERLTVVFRRGYKGPPPAAAPRGG